MNAAGIIKHRLTNQHLGKSSISTPAGIVGRMGAMQAQDYAMARWAVGVRLPGATDHQVEQAIDDASIIRTHILRPTWHLVSAADIRWMLALSGPHVKAKAASSNRQLGLDAAVFSQCNKIIRKCLEGGNQLTRAELMTELMKAGIATDNTRSAHIMFMAELDALVCNGARREKQFTYALLDERVAPGKPVPREEALAMLTERYFTGHGPATVRDFAWWSGLPVQDIKTTLAGMGSIIGSENYGDQTYYYSLESPEIPSPARPVYLLPAFDEYLVSYQDRSAPLSPAFFREVFTINGIFKPAIVLNGKIAGTWSRSLTKDTVTIRLSPFREFSQTARQGIASAAARFGRFLGMKLVSST